MTSSYMAFSPTCYTPPSLSGFKPVGRDKLGLHGIFQQSQQRQLHSLSAAYAAHADFLCFTSKIVEHSRYLLDSAEAICIDSKTCGDLVALLPPVARPGHSTKTEPIKGVERAAEQS